MKETSGSQDVLTWAPGEKLQLIQIQLKQNDNQSFKEQLSVLLAEAPVLKYKRTDFKRQVWHGLRVIDHGEMAVLGAQLKIHQNRFQKLDRLRVNNGFVTRKGLENEYFIQEHITYPQCQQLCVAKSSTMIHTAKQLQEIFSLTPRYRTKSWLLTAQNVSLEGFNSNYSIRFDDQDLVKEYKKLGFNGIEFKYFDENQKVRSLDQAQIGVR